MDDMPPQCPDCGVEMEGMTPAASTYKLQFVSGKNREGILGSIGVKQKFDAKAFVCSECGLSRVYADLDD